MAQENVETIKLQMAMAFGQGAGFMLASSTALETLLNEQGWIVERAALDWQSARWTVIGLMRLLGQLSAVHAASSNALEIEWVHVQKALPPVMSVCPCFSPGA